MAGFGANYPCFKANSKSAGVVLGKLIAADLTVNLASGEVYADDALAEQLSEFASGSIAMETDDLEDSAAQEVYGCKVSEKEATYNKDDTAPMGALAYYKRIMRSGVKQYKGYYYPSVRAALGNDSAKTRGSNITFTTTSTTFTVFADENGDWRKTIICDTVEEVKQWINTKCAIQAAAKTAAQTAPAADTEQT